MNDTKLEKLLTANQIAKKFNIKANALAIWRHKGIGPKYLKLSRRAVRYRRSDVDAWLIEQEILYK